MSLFLDALRKRNPGLIAAAVEFHQQGTLPANTVVLDADAIEHNAAALRCAAERLGLCLYFMLKQIRNPQVLDSILRRGERETVCVDADDARLISRAGHGIGHVGHLVQLARHEIREVLRMRPEVVTVFSAEKARHIAEEASRLGIRQDLLLRVAGEGDVRFPSMEGGILEADLATEARIIGRLDAVRIVGVTNFPALSYAHAGKPRITENLRTTLRCAEILRREGFPVTQINAPGNTCTLSMEALAEAGATHVEPGHGLTGTTPFTLEHELPELPAMLYITEVLHLWNGLAYVHGGGFYSEDRMILGNEFRNRVLVGRDAESIADGAATFAGCAPGGQPILIDYHGVLEWGTKREIRVGDSAVFGFRTQVFATRSARTAVVRGLSRGQPRLLGVFDRCGHPFLPNLALMEPSNT